MKIDFTINWGYKYLYSRRHYHPIYIWDGNLTISEGTINNVYKLEYPYVWFGIPDSALETKLEKPEWKDSTKRRYSGIRVEAEVTENSEFVLSTKSGEFKFSAKDIIDDKYIEFPLGPKYLSCYVTVTQTGYRWFKALPEKNEIVIDADDLNADVRNWARSRYSWISAGDSLEFKATISESKADFSETLFHFEAMAAKEYGEEKTSWIETYIPMELYCDGKKISEFKHFFRKHDATIEILDDLWQRVKIAPGEHTFGIKNNHESAYLLIGRISLSPSERNHGQLSIPNWALVNEKVYGRVFAVKEDTIKISGGIDLTLDCVFGWNEFEIQLAKAGITEINTQTDSKEIEIFDCEEEEKPIKIGYDLTQICHDDTGELDWILDYTQRTRLGNFAVIRSFMSKEFAPNEEVLYNWGKFCKEHGIYLAACTSYHDGALARGAEEMFDNCGPHEYPGAVYAFDPKEPYASKTMKEAAEHYMDYLKIEIDKAHKVCKKAAFGDGSGGIRYSFLAGADLVRAETMVPHTMTILSQARPAAESLGEGSWGVHIAEQHAYYPYRKNHMGQYFLSLMQPWVMGADIIYEEDTLFGTWSEDRQAWKDKLVREKRDMTREFFKFAKTHPRQGKNVRNIGYIEGRYAAPFNGFICGTEQDPNYSVWGLFGNNDAEWGHLQPEKARQLLDVLMPGANTMPLRQKMDMRRFFFSGTPYGDFDCVPIESDTEYLNNYKLLLNLGWNSQIEEDYEKLKSFVENGGTLFTGLVQFSKHLDRKFLKDMKDLNLYNDGDLSDFLGLKVLSQGDIYSGQWNCANRENIKTPVLSAMPSVDENEDGEGRLANVELTDAEVVAWDSSNGAPLVVRNKLGKGYVYTMTIWAYPGHEKFQSLSASWISYLSEQALPEIYVEDTTNEIFWSRWVDGEKTIIMLLNTDWTVPSNEKKVNLVIGKNKEEIIVTERVLTIAEIENGKITVKNFGI
ncbi:MAG: hypothetical protein IKL09_04925 [Clostridia bacterium]|nr:hypothetical protein [Clostridia bacterium]